MKNKFRYLTVVAALLLNVVCTVLVFWLDIETTSLKIFGSYIAILIVTVLGWKFPLKFHVKAFVFVFLAASLGSCVNLYRHVDIYDLLVHYLSGILLAECGLIVFQYITATRGAKNDYLIETLFSFFFSSSCAGFWEIYEYTADCIIGAGMQGTKENTMGDIIAGVLGALTFVIFSFVLKKAKKLKKKT